MCKLPGRLTLVWSFRLAFLPPSQPALGPPLNANSNLLVDILAKSCELEDFALIFSQPEFPRCALLVFAIINVDLEEPFGWRSIPTRRPHLGGGGEVGWRHWSRTKRGRGPLKAQAPCCFSVFLRAQRLACKIL
jgi:hypothetical protein